MVLALTALRKTMSSSNRRSGRLSTSRRTGAAARPKKAKAAGMDRPRLLDEFQIDVTPRSLLVEGQQVGVSITAGPQKASHDAGGLEDSFDDIASVGEFSTGGLSVRSGGTDDEASEDGGGPRASADATGIGAEESKWGDERQVVHESSSLPIAQPLGASGRSQLPTTAQALQAGLLDEEVEIVLSETDTVTVMSIPSTQALAGEEEDRVAAANEAYAALSQTISKGGDAYSTRHTQTTAAGSKNKSSLARPPRAVDAGAQATAWAMLEEARLEAESDAWREDGALPVAGAGALSGATETLEAQVQGVVAASLTAPGATLEAEDAVVVGPALPRGVELGEQGKQGKQRKSGQDPKRLAVLVASARPSKGGAAAAGGAGGGAGDAAVQGRPGQGSAQTSSGAAQDLQSSSQSMAQSSSMPVDSSAGGAVAIAEAAVARNRAKEAEGMAFDEAVLTDPNMMDAVTRKQAERVIRGRGAGALLASMRAVERVLVQARHHAAHRLYRAPAGSAQARALAAEMAAEAAAAAAGGGEGKEEEGDEEDDADEEGEAAGKRVGFAAGPTPAAADAAGAAVGESLAELWSYESEAVASKGLAVSDCSWSPATPSILAVAYGPPSYAAESEGCLCLWSMKNPSNPAVQVWMPVGVTALCYSATAPTLLAAGLYDGRVAVFDTKRLLASARAGGKGGGGLGPDAVSDGLQPGCHTEAVWQVAWVDRGGQRGERLVSVSTDGRVNEWSAAKGLECHTLMTLRAARTADGGGSDTEAAGGAAAAAAAGSAKGAAPPPTQQQLPAAAVARGAGRGMGETAGGQTQRAVSRGASGLCFAFLPPSIDATKYLVGTEDGFLHTCSVSYAAQYLKSQHVHEGPTNRVRLSPTHPLVCLTCGSDWTLRMWLLDDHFVLLKTYSVDDAKSAVVDVAWSPQLPTRFASVSEGGHLMVWEADQLTPVIHQSFTETVMVAPELVGAVAAGGGGSGGAVAALLRPPAPDSSASRAAAASAAKGEQEEDEEDEEDEEAAARRRTRDAAAAAAAAARPVERPRRFTCLAMAPAVPVLAVGDASGKVSVFRIVGAPAPPATAAEAWHQLGNRLFGDEEGEEL